MWHALLFALVMLRLGLTEAELTGVVVDPSGAPVAQAAVTLTELATNARFGSTSAFDGGYQFSGVRPGRYSVMVEAPGFQRVVRQADA